MVPRALAGRLARLDVKDPAYLAALDRWTQPSPDGVDGLYLSPILPEVAEHIGERLTQLLSRYRFDGVHLDSTQFPSSDFDYGRTAVAAFRAEIADGLTVAARRELDAQAAVDPLTYPDAFPRQWTRFRRSKMTALVARLATIVRRSRTGARLSVSVVADQDEALGRRLQDWRTWADNGFVDILCLQPGSETAEEFEFQVRAARQPSTASAPRSGSVSTASWSGATTASPTGPVSLPITSATSASPLRRSRCAKEEYVDHSGRRGARPARREECTYREYVSDEQRSRTGCIGGQNGQLIPERVLEPQRGGTRSRGARRLSWRHGVARPVTDVGTDDGR